MKTIREYIDQLDEISRRDFLKGAGAAAVGAVGTKIADRITSKGLSWSDVEADPDFGSALIGLLYLYYVSKTSSDPDAQRYHGITKGLVGQLIAENPSIKDKINADYRASAKWLEHGDYNLIKRKTDSVWALRDKTIQRFNDAYQKIKMSKNSNSKNEFNEEDLEEQATPTSIEKINSLFQDK